MLASAPDGLGDHADVVGDFRDQDHVRAAGDARAQRQPAGPVAHDLGHDDPVMAVGGAVQPVNGLGRDSQRGVEPEGGIGQGDVVVYGFGQGQHVQAVLRQRRMESSARPRNPSWKPMRSMP